MDPHLEGRVRNRIDRARAKLATAQRLLASEDWDDAISRAYYAAYHAAHALLLVVGLEPKSPAGTVSLFGFHFIKTGQLDAKLGRALRERDGVPLRSLVARGLTMGDEMHQRNVACSGLLLRELAPALARTSRDGEALAAALAFIGGNDQFFLNVAMAMGKAIMDPVRAIEASSVVTAMSRNGTDFGIRVSGAGDTWFTAPVEMPEGLYFPGYSAADANPDMGDSTIVETVGLGGFAMGASPAVAGFVGAGAASEAGDFTRRMLEITVGENPEWTIPALDYQGVPTGIDIRLVVETGLAPTINTGIAHKEPGIGQVGAGVVRAPLACFEQALQAFAERLGVS